MHLIEWEDNLLKVKGKINTKERMKIIGIINANSDNLKTLTGVQQEIQDEQLQFHQEDNILYLLSGKNEKIELLVMIMSSLLSVDFNHLQSLVQHAIESPQYIPPLFLKIDQPKDNLNPKQQLEQLLFEHAETSDHIHQQNKIKRQIKFCFQNNNPHYITQTQKLINQLKLKCDFKLINSQYITGQCFDEIILQCVEVINQDKIPVLNECLEKAIYNINQQILQQTISNFHLEINPFIQQKQNLRQNLKQVIQNCQQNFQQNEYINTTWKQKIKLELKNIKENIKNDMILKLNDNDLIIDNLEQLEIETENTLEDLGKECNQIIWKKGVKILLQKQKDIFILQQNNYLQEFENAQKALLVQIQNLKQQNEQQTKNHHQQLQLYEDQIVELKTENQKVEIELQKSQSENISLQFQNQQLQLSLDENQNQKEKLLSQGDEEYKQASNDIINLKKQLNEKNQKLQIIQDEIFQNKKQIVDQQSQNSELQIKINNIENIQRLKNQKEFQELQQKIDKALKENQNLIIDKEELTEEFEMIKFHEQRNLQKIQNLQNENIQQNQVIVNLKQNIQNQQIDLQNQKNQEVSLEQQNNMLKNQINYFEKKQDKFQKEITDINQNQVILEEINNKLSNELQNSKEKDLENIETIQNLKIQIQLLNDLNQQKSEKIQQQEEMNILKKGLQQDKQFQQNILNYLQKNYNNLHQQKSNDNFTNSEFNDSQNFSAKYKNNNYKTLNDQYLKNQKQYMSQNYQNQKCQTQDEQFYHTLRQNLSDQEYSVDQQNEKIEIISVEQVKQDDNLVFNIKYQTSVINSVNRSLAQFLELRNKLAKLNYDIPESADIFEIKNLSQQFDAKNLEKKIYQFLVEIAQEDNIQNCDVFRQFLKLPIDILTKKQMPIFYSKKSLLNKSNDDFLLKKKSSKLSETCSHKQQKSMMPNFQKSFTKTKYNENEYQQKQPMSKSKKNIYLLPSENETITYRNVNKLIIQQKIEKKITMISQQKKK